MVGWVEIFPLAIGWTVKRLLWLAKGWRLLFLDHVLYFRSFCLAIKYVLVADLPVNPSVAF